MRLDEFEILVNGSLKELPENILSELNNVGIVIENFPNSEQKQKGGTREGQLLLGLYEGVPRTKRGIGYNLTLPDKITIFQKNIESIAQTPQDIQKLVRRTVWHEIAHHFGFDEVSAQKLDRKRGQR